MARALVLAFALASVGCSTLPQADQTSLPSLQGPSTADRRGAQVLLEQLYRSFNHGPGQEPDWDLMRTLFVDGAQFVPEPGEGASLRSYDVDALIARWQTSMRAAPAPNRGYAEWIGSTRVDKVGKLLRVDVVFHGKAPDDPHPRKPGLDSLLLARVDGEWKVLSFVVHEESRL